MGPDLTKLSEDELWKRLGLVNSRLAWMRCYSHCSQVVQQCEALADEVLQEITERAERARFDAILGAMPPVVNTDSPKEKKQIENSNSRAKSRSDMITRLRRSATPSNLKDA